MAVADVAAAGFRLAELLVALSGVADLGMGLPVGSAARTAAAAVSLARVSDYSTEEVDATFYAALLQHIGCTAYSHEVSALFADETSIKRASLATDFTSTRDVALGYLPRIVREAGHGERFRTLRSALLHSRSMTRGYQSANCETAAMVAQRLGLPDLTRAALLDNFEWWNGGGGPRRLRADDISPVARVVNVAGYAVFFDHVGGPGAARQALARRAGGYLDPDLVTAFTAHIDELLVPTEAGDASDRLLEDEPSPQRRVADTDALEEVLRVFGEAVDLKSPFLHGHCTGVADLVDRACGVLGLSDDATRSARRAALVQDIGRVAVPNGVWEHPGPLGSDAWQQVRLHAYHSEQILNRCEPLSPIARLAGSHHERLDGSGYHRGSTATQLPIIVRVLAVADVRHALVSERPHRPPLSSDRADAVMHSLVQSGSFDADAVHAVLTAAARPTRIVRARPAGLTERQVEVLRLVASGLSNRAIAEQLVISPRTAEHHVQNVYACIGVSSRAAAAMFAMQHGLI